jgi:transposase-like protein
MDLPKLIEQFGSEERCRAYLEDLRWPDGLECPRCGGTTISRIHKRNQFDCDSCRYQFSVTAGTIFNRSHLPLWKWFLGAYLVTEAKKGIPATQLQRTLGIGSYKTAWYLGHRIRAAMGEVEDTPLTGIVEVDETWIGGKSRNIGSGQFKKHQALVVGAVERDGNVVLKVIADTKKQTLHSFIKQHVAEETEAIYTDAWVGYDGIEDENTRHETINHHLREYARGEVHTNTVEGVWSLFKRAVVGQYHQLSVKHLPAYLDEIEFRHNNRNNPNLFRDTLLVLIHSEPLPFKELVHG